MQSLPPTERVDDGRTEDHRRWLIRYGELVFRYRNGAFPVVLILIVIAFPPLQIGPAPWLDALGYLLIFAGESLRIAVVGLAYIKRGGVNKHVYASSLVTEGIFAHCRNPLYAGNLLILSGVLAIAYNPWSLVVGLGFFGFSYIAVVAAEETYLSRRFGEDYRDYCARVPRWLAAPSGIERTLRSMRFRWHRVLTKEYSTVTMLVVTVCALIAYESILQHGVTSIRPDLVVAAALASAALAGAVVVRSLKKRGRLREPST